MKTLIILSVLITAPVFSLATGAEDFSAVGAAALSQKARELAAKSHRIQCFTLDEDYKQSKTQTFFIIVDDSTSRFQLHNVSDIALLSRLHPDPARANDYSSTVCKKKGWENSSDYAHSYERCGFDLNIYQTDSKDVVTIRSGFNAGQPASPPAMTSREKIQRLLNPEAVSDKMFQRELETVGHIFFYSAARNGSIDHTKTIRIQCKALGNISVELPHANR